MKQSKQILGIYDVMRKSLGPSHWWPGDSPFEIAIGAILTQNTNWKNVEKALTNLKKNDLLFAETMYSLSPPDLAELIRPAGYYNIKTKRLRNFLVFLRDEADWNILNLKGQEMYDLRSKVLGVNGIGPETADSILLYALEYPTFVVDAYTARMMHRHGFTAEDIDYHELQALFMDVLPEDVALYNEYHALIVRVGKNWCKKKQGQCEQCPLKQFL